MAQLSATGRYEVSDRVKAAIGDLFVSGCCDDARTLNTIEKIFHQTGYLMDTHTAVAYTVLQDYRAATADDTVTVVASTASPFKFCDSVLEALGVAERQPGYRHSGPADPGHRQGRARAPGRPGGQGRPLHRVRGEAGDAAVVDAFLR